jgi:hypothetical protein
MTPARLLANGAGDERDHDQERSKGGDLGNVAKRISGDGLHLGLLDLDKFMICSLLVRVNSTEEAVLFETEHLVNAGEEAAGMPSPRGRQRASGLHGWTL